MKHKFLAVILIFLSILIFVSASFNGNEQKFDHKNITLIATTDGERLSYSEFKNVTEDVVFFTDSRWSHVNASLERVYSDRLNGHVPGAVVPKNTTLNFLWEVPGFGKTVLRLDLSKFKNNEKIDVNRELAIQKHELLRKELSEIDVNTENNIRTYEERSKERIRNGNFLESLNYSLWGLEKLVLEEARNNIERNRKENYTVKVVNNKENPVANTTVRYELKDRDFQLGWFEPDIDPKTKKKMESLGFNTYMQFAFWHDTEPEDNRFSFSEELNRMSKTRNFDQGISGLIGDSPEYLSSLSDKELNEEIMNHTKRSISTLGSGNVSVWECYGLGMRYMADQTLQMTVNRSKMQNIEATRTCVRTVKNQTDDKTVVTGWNIDGSEIRNESYDDVPYNYYSKLDDLNFSIGFDFMYFGGAHELYPGLVENNVYREEAIGDTEKNWIPMHHLYTVSEMLDWYSSLNRTVYIQYFQAPSNYLEGQQGYWHSPWNEDIQADWIGKYYTLVYSKPYVGGINYLEVKDSKWKDFKTGILRRNGTPKDSYHRLKNLVSSWDSKGKVKTDSDGKVTFEGYGGKYKVTLERNNTNESLKIEDKGSYIIKVS